MEFTKLFKNLSKDEQMELADMAIESALTLAQGSEREKIKVKETIAKVKEADITTNSDITSGGLLPIIVDKIHTSLRPVDNGFEKAFNVIKPNSGSSFRVRKIASGLTFASVSEGVEGTVYQFTGDKSDVSFSTYRAYVDFSNECLDDSDWFTVTDTANELYSKFYAVRSEVGYDLIQSLTDSSTYNVVYATDGTKQADKDANTINSAIADLITDGMAVAGDQFIITAPLAMKNRIDLAIAGSKNSGADGVNVAYNVTVVYSPYVDWTVPANTGTTKWTGQVSATLSLPLGYVCVADGKSKWADRQGLTIDQANNVKSNSQTIGGKGRYAGIVNQDSFRRVLSC
jgi:hypothetical protein